MSHLLPESRPSPPERPAHVDSWLPVAGQSPPRTGRSWLPARVALLYGAFSVAWILYTDSLLAKLVSDPEQLRVLNIYKGWFYTLSTAGLIYFLIRRDYGELLRSEQALVDRDSRLSAILANSPDGVLVLDAAGTIVEVNPAGLRLFESERSEGVLGTPLTRWLGIASQTQVQEGLATLAVDQRAAWQAELIGMAGGKCWCAIQVVRLPKDGTRQGAILAIVRDVTASKQADIRLQRLTRLYSVQGEINQAIVRIGSRDALFQVVCRILVEQGGFRLSWIGHVNDVAGRVNPVCHAGHEAGYLEGISISIRTGPDADGPTGTASRQGRAVIANDIANAPLMAPWRLAALERGYAAAAAFPLWERGMVRWTLNLYAEEPDFFDPSEVELLETIAADLSYALAAIYQEKQRRQADLALAEEKERLAVTLKSIGDGVITTDTGGYIVLMNQVAEDLTGWSQEQAVGMPLAEIYTVIAERSRQTAESPVATVLKVNGIVDMPGERLLLSRHGREVSIADRGSPIRNADGAIIGVVVVFRDVTDRRKLEDELLKSRKLESLGVLAGGIAHDFNNLLASILGSVSLAAAVVDPGERIHRRLLEAEKACLRARDLTQQLLTFAKGGVPVKTTTAITDVITESASLSTAGAHVRCEFDFAADLWPVAIDEGQVNQVFNNLIINAEQASPDGGIIAIQAENVYFRDEAFGLLPPGPYVVVRVSDHGSGIAPEHLPRIFDPYFTTKANGNGLGLASAYAIIRKHDGHIDVASVPGQGTTFTIYLPASPSETERRARMEESVISGKGRILVMDDSPSIRDLLGEMLAFLGYTVAYAADGNEAIDAYARARQDEQPFAAVIMDLTIPGGMGGKEATRQLLAIDPEARVIVSSGYSNDPIMSDYQQFGFKAVIAKPYRISDLGNVLAAVLETTRD
jgi:PAS domain S-box-containing protein